MVSDVCNVRLQSNKPMMERRRRERINQCLDQLKTLVLTAQRKDVSIGVVLYLFLSLSLFHLVHHTFLYPPLHSFLHIYKLVDK